MWWPPGNDHTTKRMHILELTERCDEMRWQYSGSDITLPYEMIIVMKLEIHEIQGFMRILQHVTF